MKNNISRAIFALLIIALIIFSSFGIFVLFNSLVAYKNASGNDWINFTGGVIGSLIVGIITLITVYYTIKNNNKNQKEAHDLQTKLNIENNNIQASLKVQDNLNRKMETERSVLETTYNHLENFLFSVSNMLNKNDDYIEMKNDYLRLYKEVISSINNIRFNSEIFDDRSQCENCSMCEIKTYGILIKSAADIQKEMTLIDEECRNVLKYLEKALNTAYQSKQLIDESANLQKMNTTDSILLNDKRIEEIEGLLKSNLKIIEEQISFARDKATQIDNKNKLQLYVLIRKYFANYNLYISEMVFSVEKNGKKTGSGCVKLNFERNHTENQ